MTVNQPSPTRILDRINTTQMPHRVEIKGAAWQNSKLKG